MKRYVIDIDNHLLFSEMIECRSKDGKHVRYAYELKYSDDEEIKYVNDIVEAGHEVTLWTGRGWDCEELTRRQLIEAGIKYLNYGITLFMGKPLGTYVDKEALHSLKDVHEEISKRIIEKSPIRRLGVCFTEEQKIQIKEIVKENGGINDKAID